MPFLWASVRNEGAENNGYKNVRCFLSARCKIPKEEAAIVFPARLILAGHFFVALYKIYNPADMEQAKQKATQE